ncbi:alpha/beta fold hydrolase [Agromyces archimandritae]|uniref:Alpha/beta fold hydrolase n=1 Tax=Agromyces archimandritae TaxID=2781962 RepID=A0A975FPU2_9MICO|nr:alpha/beta hydrolase [Agromyces archimandritae]QTX05906.1 alpha/beta fold hydrolase [Agromyces archimandritae]
MTHLAVPGAELRFEVDGRSSAPALMMLPAGITNLGMWDPQLGMLAEEHFVVRMDYRGLGDTRAEPDAPFEHADDIRAVLDHLGIARATFIGASFGGKLALDVAVETPERVAGLVTVGSGPGGFPHVEMTPYEVEAYRRIDDAEEAGDWAQVIELEAELWAVGLGRGADAVSPLFLDEVRRMHRGNLDVIAFDAPETRPDPPAYERAASLEMPVLAMVGAHDLTAPLAQQRWLVEHLPNATGYVFGGAAHLPSLEVRTEFDAVLADWLGSNAL